MLNDHVPFLKFIILMSGTPITRYWLIPADQRPNVYASSDHELRGVAGPYAKCVGPFLQPSCNLEKVKLHAELARAAGIHLYFQAVPANVREYRNCHRQCPPQSCEQMGSLARGALPQAFSGRSNAGVAGSTATR